MHRNTGVLLAVAVVFLGACSDRNQSPVSPDGSAGISPTLDRSHEHADHHTRYVAMGTSVSMGWSNNGVLAASQDASWPSQLAADEGVPFSAPDIASPGCAPPLLAPLITFKRVDGTSAGDSQVCASNLPGVVLPTNNLSIEGQTAGDAVNVTPETAASGKGPVTSRVLPSGLTQVTAMQSMNPTFVSVEFGGNEVLPAQAGLLVPGVTYTPFATFKANYAQLIDGVKATHARAVLVSMRVDIRKFPTIRTGPELASQRSAFAGYNVTVNADCDASPNLIFVRGKVMTAIATGVTRAGMGLGPYDLSCADVPGTPDYVLTPADVTFLNDLIAQMSTEIERQALQNHYAVFPLGVLYNTSKLGVPFNLNAFLTSSAPYGDRISLDGVHPTAKGNHVLSLAAETAIWLRYGGMQD